MRFSPTLRLTLCVAQCALAQSLFTQNVFAQSTNVPEGEVVVHVLNRVAFGPAPHDIERVTQMGVERYIDQQLHPEGIALPADLTARLAALDTQQLSEGDLIEEFRNAQKQAKADPDAGKGERRALLQKLGEQSAEARLERAIESPRQLQEVMVDFWFNHFNVFQGKGLDRVLVANYEREAIRPYVFGRFRDLLGATAHHPAMLFYLDNWQSSVAGYQPPRAKNGQAPGGLNENYARELMELHTLGVDGGYTQKDVTELARMLTGWTFDPRIATGNSVFRFDARRHDFGSKEWLGRHVEPRGEAEGDFALDVLAASPATAHHISYQLAQYFVSDVPPAALVERMQKRYLETGGDIRAVLTTLLHSKEFMDPANFGAKFKTPYQFVVSAARAGSVDVRNARPLLGAMAQLGMPLYGCQTPDGYKNTEDAWLNPDAMGRRITFATALAAGRLPLDRQRGLGAPASETGAPAPLPVDGLLDALGESISGKTLQVIAQSEVPLRAALVLGSPDFMRH